MRSGTVAVIGRANAGKSTLINVIVGEKVAIVSPKPQTTRERILGILTTDDYQIVFEDTPGIYKAKNRLNDFMQRQTSDTAKDVDLILFVIDGHEGVKEEDLETLSAYSKTAEKNGAKLLVAFTKTDIMPKEKIPSELVKFAGIECEGVIPVSARKGKNVKQLTEKIVSLLPEGEKIFEEDIVSDKSEKFMLKEIMREKLLLKFDKEIPHGVAVVLNEYKIRPSGTAEVNLDIICEKQNHKAILIGKQGAALKEVSSFARESMEKFLGRKVFLTVYVKVKENWRDNPLLLTEYGYKEQ
ncbi:MAG: GTPase Era [Christensenellaceae bacterium]|nr:GTPase Era [Christensenellaceae bacterium]MDY2850978.1 GTPase Era [Christensenellaceae bacterium]